MPRPHERWAWRDWVIAAFNRDMPYDRFVIEQIAGDLLPNATQDQVVATGFLLNSRTDDFGFNVVEDPVHVHDLNATLLHLLGFDHTRLTYRVQGRDYRLTDVHGNLVKGILA